MKITKYYNHAEEQGGGAFSALRSDYISDNIVAEENKEEKSDESKEEKPEIIPGTSLELDSEKNENKSEENKDEKKNEKDSEENKEEKPDESKEEKNEEKKTDEKEPVLTLDDENENKEVEIDAWDKLAEIEGLKIEKNDYQSYIKAHDEKREQELSKEFEAKLQQAAEISIEKVLEKVKDPKTRLLIEMSQIEGMTFEKVAQPLVDIQNAKKMSDVELVRKDRELKGWKPEMIDTEIEELEERNKIKHEAEKVRMELDEVESEIQTSYNNRLAKHKELIESQQLREKQADYETMEKTFSKTDKFMDLDIPKETRDKIIANYKTGKYDNLMKDPEFKSKAILQYLFGEKAKSLLKANSFSEGRSTKTKQLHNTPVSDNGSKKVVDVSQHGQKKGAFSGIKEDMDSK